MSKENPVSATPEQQHAALQEQYEQGRRLYDVHRGSRQDYRNYVALYTLYGMRMGDLFDHHEMPYAQNEYGLILPIHQPLAPPDKPEGDYLAELEAAKDVLLHHKRRWRKFYESIKTIQMPYGEEIKVGESINRGEMDLDQFKVQRPYMIGGYDDMHYVRVMNRDGESRVYVLFPSSSPEKGILQCMTEIGIPRVPTLEDLAVQEKLDQGDWVGIDPRLFWMDAEDRTKERDPNAKPVALITGVAGQDGSYLAEFLLGLGYEVHGCDLRGPESENIAHLQDQLQWVDVDLFDRNAVAHVLQEKNVDEVYHLAAFTHVGDSFEHMIEATKNIIEPAEAVFHAAQLVSQIRERTVRVYNALTSELFGTEPPPQNEQTIFRPQSPYARAKEQVAWSAARYRRDYNTFVTDGILFNHESPRRPENFVSRKITMAVARIAYGLEHEVALGNVDAIRDWGYAYEYVQFMHHLMQADEPDRVVIGTEEGHTVKELAEYAFSLISRSTDDHVVIDEDLFRPSDVSALIADARRAKEKYGWEPNTRFKELITMMVEHDLAFLADELGREPLRISEPDENF